MDKILKMETVHQHNTSFVRAGEYIINHNNTVQNTKKPDN